ncbi:hypothetical protein GALL_521070 [mine drainage metagenome]|uniref:Uncharacterized protein n=1 Tax=mine drainage metagenome TaxID=410659 RepID=A0A1J5PFK7_9ZZZZ
MLDGKGINATKAFVKFSAPNMPCRRAKWRVCYAQTPLYADAAARAKGFDACAVVEALAGFDFDWLGNGTTSYRIDDHQAFREFRS